MLFCMKFATDCWVGCTALFKAEIDSPMPANPAGFVCGTLLHSLRASPPSSDILTWCILWAGEVQITATKPSFQPLRYIQIILQQCILLSPVWGAWKAWHGSLRYAKCSWSFTCSKLLFWSLLWLRFASTGLEWLSRDMFLPEEIPVHHEDGINGTWFVEESHSPFEGALVADGICLKVCSTQLIDLCALQDKTVRQWDVRDNLCAAVLRLQQPATVVSCCQSGHLLAVGDELGSLTFFDIRQGAVQLASLQDLHHDAVRSIASPTQGTPLLLAHGWDSDVLFDPCAKPWK